MTSCTRGCCPSPAAHFRSLRFLSQPTVAFNHREENLARDMDAYKRLLDSGLEPKGITGMYDLERDATSESEITGIPEPGEATP